MALHIKYLDSNASGANNGDSWLDAYESIVDAENATLGFNVMWMASDHQELFNADLTLGKPPDSSINRPMAVYRMDKTTNKYSPTLRDGTAPPNLGTSGVSNWTLLMNMSFHFYGVNIECGADFDVDRDESAQFTDCHLSVGHGVGNAGRYNFIGPNLVWGVNTTFTTNAGAVGAAMRIGGTQGSELVGCVLSGTAAGTGYFESEAGEPTGWKLTDCDLSGLTTPRVVRVDEWNPPTQPSRHHVTFHTCTFNANAIIPNTVINTLNGVIEAHGCGRVGEVGSFRQEHYTAAGSVITDESIYFTTGYRDFDGNVNLSYRLNPNPSANIQHRLRTPYFGGINVNPGAVTFLVQFLGAAAGTFTPATVWLEISHFPSGDVLKTRVVDTFYPLSTSNFITFADAWIKPDPTYNAKRIAVTGFVQETGLYYARLYYGHNDPAPMYVNPELGMF